ncbi:hypothetical protein J7M23_01655, partial [Candidatus Sumerlaeota bacterium]|nr:hypothetical protein [Candidatus Sumerlaeota bacterium]
LRTCSTALESYYVDHNAYPPDGYNGIPEGSDWWGLNYLITTPIAYLSSIDAMTDPFKQTAPPNFYRYMNFKFTYLDQRNLPSYYMRYKNALGVWALSSWGPDKVFGPPQEGPLWAEVYRYDPTNGTVSPGDIMRCQKYPETPLYSPND